MNGIILFDGECNLCDKSVQFIIKHDPQAYFRFASIQSEIGKNLLSSYMVPENVNSLILIEEDGFYLKSSAALRICKHLNGVWKVWYFLLLIPKPIRDSFYSIIANNRLKWFGKTAACLLPSPDISKRFL
ncbi:thiol-disulfide oxidoreductase DCC family protein [Caldibacillus lycopersici]|uniref:Thiol-disulfide oxidoreductase DCC family protein n=1 Tax=Perspicuibacillus lycopersici TaxID=1325689 RepID=A0AAE3IW39_9BACI|nr:thiol-disulfide oxidoreductase DCC family protein [Perspicuibacillus lycopersici]MCU9614688.1 thiol-disulfide oxidoreductase DCC family protein [Perspicuibacillus lycopersici]